MILRPITQSRRDWPGQAELSTAISSLASRRRDPISSASPLEMDKTREVSDVRDQSHTNDYSSCVLHERFKLVHIGNMELNFGLFVFSG